MSIVLVMAPGDARCGDRPRPEAALTLYADRTTMRKLMAFVGSAVGSYAGWAIGAPVGTMTAYMVSVVAAGAGMYAGYRLAERFDG